MRIQKVAVRLLAPYIGLQFSVRMFVVPPLGGKARRARRFRLIPGLRTVHAIAKRYRDAVFIETRRQLSRTPWERNVLDAATVEPGDCCATCSINIARLWRSGIG